jgi:hypothetical protein
MDAALRIAFCLLMLWGSGCRQRELRTVTIRCPQVQGSQAVERVVQALSAADGVVSGTVVIAEGRVTVTYDSLKMALKNLEFTIADCGFDANDTPAAKGVTPSPGVNQ